MLAFFKVFSSLEHGQVNHGLHFLSLKSVEDVTKPLSVNLDPVPLIRQVLKKVGILLSEVQEVIYGQAFIVGDGRHFDVFPLDELGSIKEESLTCFWFLAIYLKKYTLVDSILGRYTSQS
jgi:hypothetical protein